MLECVHVHCVHTPVGGTRELCCSWMKRHLKNWQEFQEESERNVTVIMHALRRTAPWCMLLG